MSYTPPPNPADMLKSHIRTAVPLALGVAATYLVGQAATKLGIHVDGLVAYSLLYGTTTLGLYSGGRWLETRRWAPARVTGRLLLSLGADLGKPTYPPTTTPRMAGPDRRHQL